MYDSGFYFICDVLSWGSSKSATGKRNFTYGIQFTNYPPPPSGGGSEGSSPAVSITPLENYTPLDNPPSPVPNVTNNSYSDKYPNSLDSSSSDSSDLLESRDIKCKKCTRKKLLSKNCTTNPIKQCAKIKAKLLKSVYSSNFVKFKMDEYNLQ